jgi:hypothetical protein
MTTAASTLELLEWIAARPRTYDETIETWKTHCPRLSVWDDAVVAGLVEVRRADGTSTVGLTDAGKALAGGG